MSSVGIVILVVLVLVRFCEGVGVLVLKDSGLKEGYK